MKPPIYLLAKTLQPLAKQLRCGFFGRCEMLNSFLVVFAKSSGGLKPGVIGRKCTKPRTYK